ncbi:MAG: 7 8-dihydro-6-hydroxymethylpterin-pyrophosphokinae hppk [Verrucomicrobiaceae bacterium]|nr:7 8-dihydro-6-hydroxymethylpterin-pyrophosphokinae hppk [Verrucomicrobiaceae bacterium]
MTACDLKPMNLEQTVFGDEDAALRSTHAPLSLEASPLGSTTYGISLGSNLGDRLAHLQRGLGDVLRNAPGTHLVAAGAVYETAPVGCPPGSLNFYNSVVEIASPLAPHAMYAVLQNVEKTHGRPDERERNAPRPLDLDILYAGEMRLDDETLTVPHPRLHLRRFVLQPLADIRPNRLIPGLAKTVAELLAGLADNPMEVQRVTTGWTEVPVVKEVAN